MDSTRVAVVALVLLVGGCSRSPAPPASSDLGRPLPSPVPDIVARVNGEPIRITQILPMARTELEKVPSPDRDAKKPLVLRSALAQYVDRELLLQEAMGRGILADKRQVDGAYDQMRREHPDDKAWASFLAEQGLDAQSFREELRAQHTVAALLEQEVRTFPVPDASARAAFDANPRAFTPEGQAEPPSFEAVRGAVEASVREGQRGAILDGLLARLRGKARIELLL